MKKKEVLTMKKILILFFILAMVCGIFTACNYQVIDTNYKFTEAIIFREDGEQHLEIKSWCDYADSDMVQITAKDGTVYLTHSTNVILICP